jgi:hypothetical protein
LKRAAEGCQWLAFLGASFKVPEPAKNVVPKPAGFCYKGRMGIIDAVNGRV